MRDIRELKDDPDAYREELTRRWSGLLSYRYIGRNHSSMNLGPEDNTVRIRHDMRNEAGGIMVAPLAISSPEGGQTDLVAVPNPVIASVQILDPGLRRADDRGGRLGVDPPGPHHGLWALPHRRRRPTPSESSRSSTDRARSSVSPPEGLERMDVEDAKLVIEDSPSLPPLWRVFGASRCTDGHWVLPELTTEFASPDAALHIGPQHIVLETAAIDLAAELAGTRRIGVQSWHVMFLARGKVGPFRVDGRPTRAPTARLACGCSSTMRATVTAPSPWARRCSTSLRRAPAQGPGSTSRSS